MASRFQSRLVGTIILVALGVIILPDILDGHKTRYKEDIASIPLKPEVGEDSGQYEILSPEPSNAELPESPVEIKETVAEAEEPVAEVTDVVKTTPKEVPEVNEYKDSGWIIQLMALKNSENAKKLVADLQKRGYLAHTKSEHGYTRVIIGPDVSKEKLEQQIIELQKITGSKGQLLKFKPLNP
ncbi:SPOR domain-containing protein [Vibrio quintilis]|uniref:Cell division protein DedD n=1 Tax=Vibrio quintilis TaxID=1117707 RepID=A0A1M7Z081_9VIBR|nr:SPOR domain-containing protein [Vibrio quintilis]SHO58222.1 cell division protein DedD [Vibrio quintilis]